MKKTAEEFTSQRAWINAFLIGSFFLVAFFLVLGLTRSLGFDPIEFHALMMRMEEQRALKENLLSRDRAFIENIEGKKRVIDEVLAERLTLQEAAARFRTLNQLCPEYDWERFRIVFPGRDDDERHCRQVIYSLRQEIHNRPAAYKLLARLESQLQEGTVRS
ncbi:MAG: hypothetical protein ACJ8FY_08860 [Gemmataceae bacterium]